MAKTKDSARIKTLKRMVSVSKTLIQNESIEIFELAHHIADNVLNKICMLVGIEKNGENSIYEPSFGRKNRTKDFNVLYKTTLEKYYPNVPKYDDLIRTYHRHRNTYNHDIISLDFSIRKPIAETYVAYVEDILREVGYLDKNETIEPSLLISNTLLKDLNFASDRLLKQKFEQFYARLTSHNPEHMIVEVKSLIEDIGAIDLGKILKMEYTPQGEDRIMLIEHNQWNLSIRTGSFRHLRLIKYVDGTSQTYDFEMPDQNEEILNEFLALIRARLREHGMLD